jgi:hypothetical protein
MSDYPRPVQSAPEVAVPYRIDQRAALLDIAVHVGMGLVWLVGLLRLVDKTSFADWLSEHWRDLFFYAFGFIYGAWACLGVLRSRRWAFVTRILLGLLTVVPLLAVRPWIETSFDAIAIGYCLLRLVGVFGPRLSAVKQRRRFLPDQLVAGLACLFNLGSLGYWVFQVASSGALPPVWSALDYLGWVAQNLWFTLGLFQSRGWALVGAALTGLMLTVWQTSTAPWWATAINVISLLYIGLRMIALGPRIESTLGLDSE